MLLPSGALSLEPPIASSWDSCLSALDVSWLVGSGTGSWNRTEPCDKWQGWFFRLNCSHLLRIGLKQRFSPYMEDQHKAVWMEALQLVMSIHHNHNLIPVFNINTMCIFLKHFGYFPQSLWRDKADVCVSDAFLAQSKFPVYTGIYLV